MYYPMVSAVRSAEQENRQVIALQPEKKRHVGSLAGAILDAQ